MINEFDIEDEDLETKMSESQRVLLANPTILSTESKELNNATFRGAYMREKVTARDLAERKAERQQIVAQHKENIKSNTKKNLVFSFVKSSFLT